MKSFVVVFLLTVVFRSIGVGQEPRLPSLIQQRNNERPPQLPASRELKLPTLLAAEPVAEAPGSSVLQQLIKSRYNDALAETRERYVNFISGRETTDTVTQSGLRLLKAGIELHETRAERAVFLTQYLELMKEVEKMTEELYRNGIGTATGVYCARSLRLDAEIRLIRTRGERSAESAD